MVSIAYCSITLVPVNWFVHNLAREKILEHTNLVGCIAFFIAAIGLKIACWSIYLLGKNWILSVQKKESHELIQTGFNAIVRHPIYAGTLLIFTGNVVIVGDYRGFIAWQLSFFYFGLSSKKKRKF